VINSYGEYCMTKEFFDRGKWIAKWADNQPVWQRLSDDEIDKLYADWERGQTDYSNYARAIEQALKEKNNV